MKASEDGKARLRIARFLSAAPVEVTLAGRPGRVLLDGGERGTIAVVDADIRLMASDGLVMRDGAQLVLSDAGRAFLARQGCSDPFLSQHREMEAVRIELPSGPTMAQVNLAESPLAQLSRRKDRNGRPYLEEREWRAGERLRADYTRGQMMPRLGSNWTASVAAGRRDGTGTADITDAALAARLRVDRAIDAVGPELSGVLIDICCFLKGLEQVELERSWPARSAKLLLKTALAALARHYEPERTRSGTLRPKVLHWGTTDYRPSIGA